MANWIHKDNVMVDGIFKKMGNLDTYLIKLRIPNEKNNFTEPYEIFIQSANIYAELKELIEGKRERCYFAYGMGDIDFYKLGDKFAITDSSSPGNNIQLILAYGELEQLVNSLEFYEN